ncbi:MAG: hypothetical protein ACJA1C_002514 [Crocinitomicaceae bacterium]|jgi:hypothetical protein
MMKYNYTIVLGLALLFSSCANEKDKETPKQNPVHSEHDHGTEESIELNDGEKWVVVDEMMGHIKNMGTDIKQFEVQTNGDYNDLAVKLEGNLDLLTSSCTMTGKAHDELHKWLLPYIDLVKELSTAENDTEAEQAYKEIQSSFETFNTYFK